MSFWLSSCLPQNAAIPNPACDCAIPIIGFDPKRDMPFKGTRHNALDDAIHQAKYVSAIWKKLAK
ncbi:3'-5' exoribonuclease domain-containing protein [Escherichia coli]|uniref:3'-5' exoribonuclease domain-containing protein n=1 Tax=Escherichia coli TaxID=562 RepID=UPI00385580C8